MKNKYYIYVNYFYYPGTFYAPKDGALKCQDDGKLVFDSIEDAKNYLKEEGISYQLTPQSFCREGRYTLFHGEYAEPKYKVRKKRTKEKIRSK